MKRILITGGNGQLGRTFAHILSRQERFEASYHDLPEFDLRDDRVVRTCLDSENPDAIINCAAYTQVDEAENKEELSSAINAEAAGKLAVMCAERAIPLIHYSSDYVYHNGCDRPLSETDPTFPKGVYAKTKLEGDRKILASGCVHYILRTSWVYAPFGQNFVLTMLKLAESRDQLQIVSDQIGAPTYTFDLAKVSLMFLDRYFAGDDKPDSGIYNFAGDGVCSWYDFATEIFRIANKKMDLSPVRTSQFPRPAPRPHYSLMDQAKIKATLGLPSRHWSLSLKDCMDKLQSKDGMIPGSD